jgi:hypothetical protein
LKQFLGGMRMRRDEDAKKTVKDWFSGLLEADFYDANIQKLVIRYKCLNLRGDYVEK